MIPSRAKANKSSFNPVPETQTRRHPGHQSGRGGHPAGYKGPGSKSGPFPYRLRRQFIAGSSAYLLPGRVMIGGSLELQTSGKWLLHNLL